MNNTDNLYQQIVNLLYNEKEGLLIKYHFNQGLDLTKLSVLYDLLEEVKTEFEAEEFVSKKIAFVLIGIIPALYTDLPLYSGDPGLMEEYQDLIYKLDTALMMCLSDRDDPFFDTPLKEL